jgi:hypothetical protein
MHIAALSARPGTDLIVIVIPATGMAIATMAIGTGTTVGIGLTGAGVGEWSLRRGRTTTTTTTIIMGTSMTVPSRIVCGASSHTIWLRAPISVMMAIGIRARDRISERLPRGGLSSLETSRNILLAVAIGTYVNSGVDTDW